jgi:outer membrane immunogenic protein
MKKHFAWVLASIITVGAWGQAMAADLAARPYTKAPPAPVMAVYNWTGFYLGINGGGGWARTSHTDTTGLTTGRFDQSGGLVGGTAGFNWQANNIVFGIEGDWDWADINGSSASPLCLGANCFTNLRQFGTIRGRIGYAWNQWLFYGTGGAAFGDVHAGQDGCPVGFCGSNIRTGWTAGVGLEVGFAQNWSAKIEYLHFDLGDKVTYTPVIPVSVEEHGDIVRAGLNYRFNWGGPVVARY